MGRGTRVRMRDIGGQRITGTVLGPGPTSKIRPLNPAENEDVQTVTVKWDDPALGSNVVVPENLEILPDE